uniref:G_PROTEIN_RECEP_F1_2 domain-containing protein n=1 Tax=Caenorhabditis tropicalis TaxID=1561998 RepID=A0A1I7UJL6_9PELO
MQPVPLYPLISGYVLGYSTNFGANTHICMIVIIFLFIYQIGSMITCFVRKHQAIAATLKRYSMPPGMVAGMVLYVVVYTCSVPGIYSTLCVPEEEKMNHVEKNYPQYLSGFRSVPTFAICEPTSYFIKSVISFLIGGIIALLALIAVLSNIFRMLGILKTKISSSTYRKHRSAIYSLLAQFMTSSVIFVPPIIFVFVVLIGIDGAQTLAYMYVIGAPIIFPVAAVFQTSSVYFCVAAAVDCFIIVVLPESVKQLYCTPRRAKMTCTILMIMCSVYNIPHFFELEKVDCLDEHGLDSMQICPTDIRLDPAYYAIYYTYMYTTFLAIGPLTLLILLNVCVVFTVVTKGSADENGGKENGFEKRRHNIPNPRRLFFIFCNFTALMVNFMELIFNDPTMLVYFVDLSNLLVVVNGTANFFCYFIFGTSFRNTLKKIVLGSPAKRSAVLWINDQENKNQQTHALI